MARRSLRRRSFLGAGLSIVALPAYARFLRAGGVPGSVAPTTAGSLTFGNTSGSASPSGTPVQTGMWFSRAAVPSGQIAVPQISGSDLATWQADNIVYWDDGSLMGAVYRFLLPSGITGSGTQQVTFQARAGSWSNTSSVVVGTVTGESNFNVALTNAHTAQFYGQNASVFDTWQGALTIAGGVISGGVVPYNLAGSGNRTYTVTNGRGSGASVTVTGTSLSVVSGGSGYLLEGHSNDGIINASFNTASAGSAAKALRQYAKGPSCDAWTATMQMQDSAGAAFPHMVAVFWIERWKKADGTLLAYKVGARIANGLISPADTLYNITCDADWKNGSTVIRGKSNSSTMWNGIPIFAFSGFSTFDDGSGAVANTGRLDWCTAAGGLHTNDNAFKAIISQMTVTEMQAFKATGLVTPMLATYVDKNSVSHTVGSSIATPVTQAAFTNGSQELTTIPLVQPMANAGLRSPVGFGGPGHNEAIYPDNSILHMVRVLQGDAASAQTWLACARGAAANSACMMWGNPHVEPATYYTPNAIPATTQAFSGMAPTRELWDWFNGGPTSGGSTAGITQAGYTSPIQTDGAYITSRMSAFHLAAYELYPYLIEGEQWPLDQLLWTAGTLELYQKTNVTTAAPRVITLGATTYYSVKETWADNRDGAWPLRTLGFAAQMMPTVWADGSTNIERSYFKFSLGNNFDFMNAFVPFTGSMTWGSATYTGKTHSWAGSGMWCAPFDNNHNATNDAYLFFMDCYMSDVCCWLSWINQDKPQIATFRDYFTIAFGGRWSFSGSHFLSDGYWGNATVGEAGPATNQWDSYGNPSSPNVGVAPLYNGATPDAGAAVCTFKFTAGSSTLQVMQADSSTGGQMQLTWAPGNAPGGTVFTTPADGTAILLSQNDLSSGNAVNTDTIPSPYATGVWYYWKNIDKGFISGTQTGQLYTDQGLTIPVGNASAGMANCSFYMSPSQGIDSTGTLHGLPADNSGCGGVNGANDNTGASRAAEARGSISLLKAYGANFTGPGSTTLADALNNLNTICTAVGINYTDEPIYAFDPVL